MSKLNDFAPYPEREKDATADRLARNFAVLGHANHRRMFDANDDERHDAVTNVVSMYGFAFLLREFAKADKDSADAAARDLWSAWDAGDSLGEWLWEWLSSDYGIDPAAVTRVAEETLAKPSAKSTRALLTEAEADRDRARDIAVALEQENARVRARHSSRTLTEYADDDRREETGHTWEICEACTDPDVMDALDSGELAEESETAHWPCATIRAMNGEEGS